MLKKQNRLSKTKDVATATKRGRSFFGPYFVVKYLKTTDVARVTVVVSTKVSKKAVVRNRIKRVLRDFIRRSLLTLKPGDYVIIVKPVASKLEAPVLREQLLGLLQKTRLL
jgi:ribonuclease P protein component